jgi:Spy/CpxP family protein refolding chaperone
MRKLMLAGALMLAGPALAAAQEAPRGPGRGMPMANSVEFVLKSAAEFNATPEQVSKIEEINKKFDKDTESLRAELLKIREERGSADRQTVMQKMRPLREELQKKDEAALADVLKLLNDEQKKSVSALLESRREKMQNRRRAAGRDIKKQ